MSKKIKDEQKKFLGETLNQYDKALNEGIDQLDKKNREQNHKISSLVNSFDNEYLEKDVEGNMTALENSKDGMVIINEIQGSTEVNYCKDGEKELILNGDIDTQGESFVTITESVDGGLVDVSLEGNTEINLSKTKDPVLVTREFDDINCNVGKLQYTIDDVTTINDEPGKVDIDRIVGDTMVNHAVNGSEELILNAHINESGDNNITLNGVTSDSGKVDVYLEGNTLVNVSNVKDDYITPTIEDKVDQGSVISLPEVSEGLVNIDSIEGNTLVNYCTDGAKELTLNGDIDVEGTFVTVTEGVDNGLVDVMCEGNTLVNLSNLKSYGSNDTMEGDFTLLHPLVAGNTYSLIFDTISIANSQRSCFWLKHIGGEESDVVQYIEATENPTYSTTLGKHVLVFTATSDYEQLLVWFQNIEEGGIIAYDNIMLLEGDWTDKETPQYFEGMKSVGQDDENGHKIEIVSENKNLYDYDTHTKPYGNFLASHQVQSNGIKVIANNPGTRGCSFIRLSTNEDLYISIDIVGNGSVTKKLLDNTYIADYAQNNGRVRFKLEKGRSYKLELNVGETTDVEVIYDNIIISKNNYTDFVPHSGNKKEILLNEPLRSLPDGTKDRFVKIGGKWFVERKCGSIGLSEIINNVALGDASKEETIRFKWKSDVIPNMKPNSASNFYCNNFKYAKYSDDIEGIDIGKDLDCNILRSRLQTQDIDGFKQWVGNNPTTIIYGLATPTYEPLEIEPTLNTYNEVTHLSNNSIIPCNMQIKNTGYNAIIKPSTLYTVALDTNKSGTVVIDLGGMKTVTTNNVVTITTPAILSDDSLRLYGKGIKCSKVRLLEGDKTNWIPSFFEGMQSSFEDKIQEDGSYKMEILMSNENLFDVNKYNTNDKWYTSGWNTGFNVEYKDGIFKFRSYNGWQSYWFDFPFNLSKTYCVRFKAKIDSTSTHGGGSITAIRYEVPVDYYGKDLGMNIGIDEEWIEYKVEIRPKRKQFGFCFKFNDEGMNHNLFWLVKDIQISEIESNNYTPHKENKIQFSSIEPLRGVGDVHDRLVFKDGKLMIERNCKEVILSDKDEWRSIRLHGNTMFMQCYSYRLLAKKYSNGNSRKDTIFCDKHPTITSDDNYNYQTSVCGIDMNKDGVIGLRVNKNNLSSVDEVGFKEYIRNNNIRVVFQLEAPTYEEIPYELQKIILESYNNGTLFIDTNIPPTKVSFNCFEEELTYLYPSTSYTVQFISDRTTTADVNLGGTQLLAQSIVQGLNRITITTPSELADSKLLINGAGAKISDVVVTDTNREFKYFEGMKSVGECEGNVIEVLSNNRNLFEKEIVAYKPYNSTFEKGENYIKITTSYQSSWVGVDLDFNLEPNEKYVFKTDFTSSSIQDNILVGIKGSNNTWVADYFKATKSLVFTVPSDGFIKLKLFLSNNTVSNIGDWCEFKNIYLEKNDTISDEYTPSKCNKIKLTHEPLRGAGDVRDRYVLIDGKWYIERKYKEVVLDGSTVSGDVSSYFPSDNSSVFFIRKEDAKTYDNLLVCDKFKPNINVSNSENRNVEGVFMSVSGSKSAIYLRIFNDKLSTQDINGFRQWLQQNPVTVVYQLAEPVYEPIDYNPLEVYSDVTHITTNSTIPTNITVKNHGYNLVALKESTQYTLYVNKDTTNALTYRLGDYVEINSPSKFTFTTPSTLTDKTLRIDGKGIKVKDLMLIEGTPTNDSIGYFNGLKSSYECEQVTDELDENYGKYKVDIKVVGKNKLNLPSAYNTWKGGRIAVTDSNVVTYTPASDGTQAMDYRTEFTDVDFKKGTQLTLSVTKVSGADYTSGSFGIGIYLRDANGSIISGGAYRCPDFLVDDPIGTVRTTTITLTQDVTQIGLYVIAWKIQGASGDYKFKVQLEEGNTATEYEPYFESKQTVYLNSPLLKGDEIVWKDNKIQHYHKMETIVLDGSDDEHWSTMSNWSGYFEDTLGYTRFQLSQSGLYFNLEDTPITIISDKFPSISNINWKTLSEHIENDGKKINIVTTKASAVYEFKSWLQQNPVTAVYKLETPYYEEISDYPLKLNVIANSSLSTESTIQVTNISFNIYEETLPYLYPNTKYYITFNADVDRNNIIIDLGGNHVVLDCKVGFNKVEITTPNDTTNLLTFSGTGVNIDHVKVTQQDIDEYFEGMKSVGECEELEVTSANSDNTLLTTQTLTHEPLRAVGNVKDRYVLLDGKWYIERNCKEFILTDSLDYSLGNTSSTPFIQFTFELGSSSDYTTTDKIICNRINTTNVYTNNTNIGICYVKNDTIRIRLTNSDTLDSFKAWLNQDLTVIIYKLQTPIYEPIDYNPFETYSGATHITANSLIPTNVVIKNHGYNCILKPSTKYTIALNKPNGTISAKLGGSAKVDSTNNVFTITTPSTLNDNVLRLSGSGNVKDIMILEGDKTINTPSYFEGIESVFEQEYDTEKGKYRVTARIKGNGKESSIIFYLNEPLRGTATAKDKVFIQDDKVVVQRNCSSITLDGSENIHKANTDFDSVNNISFSIDIDNIAPSWDNCNNIVCSTLPNVGNRTWKGNMEGITSNDIIILLCISRNKLQTQDVNGFKQWLQANPTKVVYVLAEPVYEEADCDLSKLVLENYENSSLIFESNIPVSANIKYSGEVPVVTQAKTLSSKVDNTTLDINENIIPYMCDIDYRIVELQLMNGDTQGEGIELLGIGDIEILGNENVLFNNREDKKHNFSYDMLKRDILSQRYSKEEYRYRLDRYLLAKKISDEEYKELEGLLNNGK